MTDLADRYQKIRIIWRQDHAPDLWSIRVRPEEPLSFKPGQYVTIGVEREGRVLERPYSIVSSPLEPEIEFFFELVPQGGLTPALHSLQAGDTLLMRRQAKGLFILDSKSGRRQHYLISTVTGVAPYVSMVRTLICQARSSGSPDLRVVLLQAASRPFEFAYRQELEAVGQGSKWFQYIPTVSRPWEDLAWKSEVGRVEDVLRKYLDSLGLEPASTTAYLCGHPGMIENAKGILTRRGFVKDNIREEAFWVREK